MKTYSTIITAQQLAELLQSSAGTAVKVFDIRFKLDDTTYGERAYKAGHIPGSWYLHLDRDLSSPIDKTTGRHPLPDVSQLAHTLQRYGVSADTQVVVLDDAGGMFASRCWWLLRWLGHARVAVLDGGWPAWLRSGGSVSLEAAPLPVPGSFTPAPNDDWVVSAEELQAALEAGSIVLCDARAAERYRGDVEPIDKVAGHIPGAINVPFASNLQSDGTFKSPEELAGIHHHAGQVVQMCGSGVTACHNILAAAIAGRPWPKLYAGSWSHWIVDPNRPIARGR